MEIDNKMLALYAALAAAQGEFAPIPKNRTAKIKTTKGYSYEIRYADLEAINAATRPALSKHGLALLQPLQTEAQEKSADTYIDTMLVHKDGGVIVSRLQIRGAREFGDQKEFASEVSYMRRYAITAILNLAADDDAEQNGRGVGDAVDPLDALPPDALVADAEKAAAAGTDSLRAWWNAASEENRKRLVARFKDLKAKAAQADTKQPQKQATEGGAE